MALKKNKLAIQTYDVINSVVASDHKSDGYDHIHIEYSFCLSLPKASAHHKDLQSIAHGNLIITGLK